MLVISQEVGDALRDGLPVVALESTVLAHGLPYPRNLEVGRALESDIRDGGAIPATVAVLAGELRVGLSEAELERVATGEGVLKASTRDLPVAVARKRDAATTVAATMWLSARAGIAVFATGGIGGVHRGEPLDVSADLTELGRTRQIVVSAGAKAILDLPATREALETRGVLVAGWRTDEMPAFYSRESGLQVDVRVEEPRDVAELWRAQAKIDGPGALLLCVPAPAEAAVDAATVESHVAAALAAARAAGISGKGLTPFLLSEMGRLSGGDTLEANVALLRNNARVAAAVAVAVARETA
ncbi:MAG TPA: pseudouridine-5'-phosphate glycosidase [Longimicrobiaceae bacterium]